MTTVPPDGSLGDSTHPTPGGSGAALRRTIGPYTLLQRIGQGGMGEVWLAEQERPVRRRVALKLIKPGMDTASVLARFEAERQALALMNHPYIARVYDAGSTELGRPYFAMEYVDGVPLTDYCDRNRLTTRERLELLIRVCEGVQHAHHKGVIHRDLKPSNVLVRVQGDRPVPKIIDFGVAKATDHRLTERTLYTEIGAVIGTPEYMSPEQAEMSGLDVDTRTDVYSLGVILYVLLTGELPFDSVRLRNAGLDRIRQTIREEEPPLPSSRVWTLRDHSSEIAERRRTDPTTLVRHLRGDLDWITMKALEKDRTRRYDTPMELAADIRRQLEDLPILARPPTTTYRVRKFVRRHRAGVLTASLVAVTLVAASVVSTVQYARAEAARHEAEFQAYTASLAAASAALDRNDAAGVRRQLESTVKYLRGWEWEWMWNEADRSLGTRLQLPATTGGYLMALTSDARLAAVRKAGGNTEPVLVFDLRTGQRKFELPMRESFGMRLCFSPDGRFLAYGGESPPLAQVWDMTTGEGRIPPDSIKSYWGVADFDARSERIGLGRENSVDVLRLADWKETVRIAGPLAHALSCGAFSPDGRLLAVCVNQEDGASIFDTESGAVVHDIPPGRVDALRFSPDGAYLGVLGAQLQLLDTTSWEPGAILEKLGCPVRNPGGDILFMDVAGRPAVVGVGGDGVLRAYALGSTTPGYEIRGEGGIAGAIAWDQASDRLVIAHARGVVKDWPRVPGWAIDRRFTSAPMGFWSSDGILCSAAGGYAEDPRVADFTDVDGARPLGALREFPVTLSHGESVLAWAPSADGTRLAVTTASGWEQGRLDIFDLATGLSTFTAEPFWGHDPRGVAWSPDGRRIVVVGTNGFGRVLDLSSEDDPVNLRGHEGDVMDVVFAPDGARVWTGGLDGTLRTWDPTSGDPLGVSVAPDSAGITCLASFDRGRTLLCGTVKGTIIPWDVSTGRFGTPLSGHSASVEDIAISPDGSRLVSGAKDGTVVFWDPRRWRELVSLQLESGVTGLAFSPDGKRLAFGQRIVRVLDERPEEDRERGRRTQEEARRTAGPWLDDLEARKRTPRETLDQIRTSTVQGEPVKEAALMELLVRREASLSAAFDMEHCDSIAMPAVRRQILRDLCITPESDRIWLDLRPAAAGIRARTDLTDEEREAAAEYAIAERYTFASPDLQGEGVWTNELIRETVIPAEEERHGDRALALFAAEELAGAVPGVDGFRESLGFAQCRAGLFEEAATTLEPLAAKGGGDAETWAFLAIARARLGRGAEASAALGRCEQAVAVRRWGGEDAARSLLAEARALLAQPAGARTLPPASPDSLLALRTELHVGDPDGVYELLSLEERCWDRGELEKAEALIRKDLTNLSRRRGSHDNAALRAMSLLGLLLRDRGRDEEAEKVLRDAFERTKEIRGADGSDAAWREAQLGLFLVETGRLDEAAAALAHASDVAVSAEIDDPDLVWWLRILRAEALVAQGSPADAEPLLREAADVRGQLPAREDWRDGAAKCVLGQALSAEGRASDAEPLLRDGRALLAKHARWKWLMDATAASGSPREGG